MCLWVSYKKKIRKKIFFASLKSLKKRVGSGVGSGSISQRCGSGFAQNVTDLQHWTHGFILFYFYFFFHSSAYLSFFAYELIQFQSCIFQKKKEFKDPYTDPLSHRQAIETPQDWLLVLLFYVFLCYEVAVLNFGFADFCFN